MHRGERSRERLPDSRGRTCRADQVEHVTDRYVKLVESASNSREPTQILALVADPVFAYVGTQTHADLALPRQRRA